MTTVATDNSKHFSRAPEITDLERIALAFATLRYKGYGTAMAFMCCGSCAGRELYERGFDKAVFWDVQRDAAFCDLDGDVEDDGSGYQSLYLQSPLCLMWAGDGQEIVDALIEQGLKVEW